MQVPVCSPSHCSQKYETLQKCQYGACYKRDKRVYLLGRHCMAKKMHMAIPYAMRTPIAAQQLYVNVFETPLGNMRLDNKVSKESVIRVIEGWTYR
jgi:hypothetical protein